MKKLHLKLILALTGILFAFLFLVGTNYLSDQIDWEKFDRFVTDDGHYSVIINASYPSFSSGKAVRFKITCKDEIHNKEKEIGQYKLVVSLNNDKPLFEFNNLNQRKSELIINNSSNQKVEFIWSDIFSDYITVSN